MRHANFEASIRAMFALVGGMPIEGVSTDLVDDGVAGYRASVSYSHGDKVWYKDSGEYRHSEVDAYRSLLDKLFVQYKRYVV